MKRRDFLHSSTAAASLATLSSLSLPSFGQLADDNKFRKEIGIQLYTLRNQIKEDVSKTIKAVVDAGYHQGEMYGFPNCDPMIKAAKEHDLALHSSHINWECVTNPTKKGVQPFAEVLDKANEVGLKHLVVPYLHKHERDGIDAYKKTAENMNNAAKAANKAGIQLAYHNHAFEFKPEDGGKTGFDVFMDEFEPEMQFELDVFWVKVGGVDPVTLINKLKGRVSQLHLKDLKIGMDLPNFGKVPKDAFQELGDGMIPMEPIIKAAGATGVAHCHVEQDQSPDPIKSIQQSMQYLKTI